MMPESSTDRKLTQTDEFHRALSRSAVTFWIILRCFLTFTFCVDARGGFHALNEQQVKEEADNSELLHSGVLLSRNKSSLWKSLIKQHMIQSSKNSHVIGLNLR